MAKVNEHAEKLFRCLFDKAQVKETEVIGYCHETSLSKASSVTINGIITLNDGSRAEVRFEHRRHMSSMGGMKAEAVMNNILRKKNPEKHPPQFIKDLQEIDKPKEKKKKVKVDDAD